MTCDDEPSDVRYVLAVWTGARPADLDAVTGPAPRVEGPDWVVVLLRNGTPARGERVRQALGGTYHP